MWILFFYLIFHFHVLFAIPGDFLGWADGPLPDKNIYVFGDSNFEIGRKSSGHDSWMKSNYWPYGYGSSCDYISLRFSDGKTIPEFIASPLGFDGISSVDDPWPSTIPGVNYASASAGILPETGTPFGNNLCLKEQIGVFKEYVQTVLKNKFQTGVKQALMEGHYENQYPTGEELPKYLSKSIYLINIGESDYIYNYLQPKYYNTSNRYNDEEFAELLTKEYSNYIKDLYKLGARKMVIFEISPLGCLPYMIEKLKPRTKCADNINEMVSKFNKKLDIKLTELRNEFKDLHVVTARMFSLIKNMIEASADYGFEETRWPCCPVDKNGTGLCEKTVFRATPPSELRIINPDVEHWYYHNQYLCEDPLMPEEWKRTQKWTGPNEEFVCLYRRLYLFFDGLHFTQAANRVIVQRLVAGTGGSCSPIGLSQLLIA